MAEIRVKGRQVFRVIEEKWQKFELQGISSYRGEMLVRIRVKRRIRVVEEKYWSEFELQSFLY